MGRLLGGAVALAILGWSAYALLFAVAVSPVGSGYCSADWVEAAQVVPILAAVIAGGAALYRTSRPSPVAPARTVWILAIGALALLVAWTALQGAADCAISRDE